MDQRNSSSTMSGYNPGSQSRKSPLSGRFIGANSFVNPMSYQERKEAKIIQKMVGPKNLKHNIRGPNINSDFVNIFENSNEMYA